MADRSANPGMLLDVPITFEVGDERTHAPMVHATVGGIATRLILDTGSSDHVFTLELADRAALPSERGEPGTDSTGASVPSWTLGELEVEIEGQPFGLHDVVAIAGPPPFAGWGVGGFLSPQHLHPTAWMVLDLAGERMILIEGEADQVVTWLADRSPDFTLLALERLNDDATILVLAALDPFDAVVTLLDSGGKSTEFVAAAVPGLGGGPQSGTGHGVGGGQIVGSLVENRTLIVGDARVAVPRLLVRDAMDSQDGLVGMNVLRGTILVVSADRSRPVFWLIPEPARSPLRSGSITTPRTAPGRGPR